MSSPIDQSHPVQQAQIGSVLNELGFPPHRVGYKQICIAVPCYAQDFTQSLIKEIYPYIARVLGYTDWRPVEHAIRCSIHDAWNARESSSWDILFPNCKRAPSNKQFIATLAEHLQ